MVGLRRHGGKLDRSVRAGLAAAASERRPQSSMVLLQLERRGASLAGQVQQLRVEVGETLREAAAPLLDRLAACADEPALADDGINAAVAVAGVKVVGVEVVGVEVVGVEVVVVVGARHGKARSSGR